MLRGGMPAPFGSLAEDYGEVEVAEDFRGDSDGEPAADEEEDEGASWDDPDRDSSPTQVIDATEVEKELKRGTFEADELQPEHGHTKLGWVKPASLPAS